MDNTVTVFLQIRRFDQCSAPNIDSKVICLDKNLNYNALKNEIHSVCDLDESDNKVIKLRMVDQTLIPLMELLKGNTEDTPFLIDVAKISLDSKDSTTLFQDAYLDAIRNNLRSMESRVTQAELLIPQLQWRRQAHMEHTVNTMSSRMAFLNKRIDELTPPQWKSKMPQTAS